MTTVIDNITILEGSTFEKNWVFKNADGTFKDFTGYIIRAQWRRTDTNELLATFGAEFSDPEAGSFKIALSPSGSIGLPTVRSRYDVKADNLSGSVIRLVEGDVEFRPEVTQ